MKKIVVLVSGGVDSTILAAYTKKLHPNDEVKLLHFDYGHPFEFKERKVLPEGTIIRRFDWMNPKVPYDVPEEDPTHLPGRDFAMIALTMIQEDPDRIYLGLLAGEMNFYLDQGYEFYYRLGHVLSLISPSGKRVEVEAPLEARGFDKKDAIEWALNNGFTPEQLTGMSSCMHHEERKCGICPVCIKRWIIFQELGLLKHEGDTLFANHHAATQTYNRFQMMMRHPEFDSPLLSALKRYFGTDDNIELKKRLEMKIVEAKI